jgi:hypothetical protein
MTHNLQDFLLFWYSAFLQPEPQPSLPAGRQVKLMLPIAIGMILYSAVEIYSFRLDRR